MMRAVAGGSGGEPADDVDGELRREALQIAVQLPRDREDALKILRLAEWLVTHFLEHGPPEPPVAQIRRPSSPAILA